MPRVGIREQQKTFPVTVLCKVMQVSTSAFYAWSKTPEDTDKKLLEKQLEGKAVQLFEENRKTYGSRRLSEAFIKEDFQVGHYKAGQLMKKMGLKPRYPNLATRWASKLLKTRAGIGKLGLFRRAV